MHLVYESRSLRSPFFCLALPSLFLPLSPVRAPPASFIRPLALSIAPSSLSSLPLLPPSRPICLLLSTRLLVLAWTPPKDPPRSIRLLAACQLARQTAKVLGGVRHAAQGALVLEPLPVALLLGLPGLCFSPSGLLPLPSFGLALGLVGFVARQGAIGLLGLAHRLVHRDLTSFLLGSVPLDTREGRRGYTLVCECYVKEPLKRP